MHYFLATENLVHFLWIKKSFHIVITDFFLFEKYFLYTSHTTPSLNIYGVYSLSVIGYCHVMSYICCVRIVLLGIYIYTSITPLKILAINDKRKQRNSDNFLFP